MRRFLLLFLLLFSTFLLPAQERDTLPGRWILTTRAHVGFIIAHRPAIMHLQKEHVRGFEVELARPLNGTEDWQQAYALPLYSVAYQLFNLGDKEELGNGHALLARIIFPFGKHHWLRTSLSAGLGIGYIEKHYNRYENYKNTAIGSHLNATVNISYQANFRLSKRMLAEAGFEFTHFSNGTVRPPNLGINIPTFHTGLSWFIGKPFPRTLQPTKPIKKTSFNKIIVGAGVKGIETENGISKFGISVISYSRNWIISHKSRLCLGGDAFYDGTLAWKLERIKEKKVAPSTSYRVGVCFGYILNVGKVGMLLQNGFYLVDTYKEDGIHYFKTGVEYQFSRKFMAGFYLKTHYAKADFFEYGVGYLF